MADQILKDRKGSVIGIISKENNGSLIIKDRIGSFKGSYDPKTNLTKDRKGGTVGTGNLLTTLL